MSASAEETEPLWRNEAEEEQQVSKTTQVVFTFGLVGVGCYFFWGTLDFIARGLVVVFCFISALSIHSGTWMQNSRELKRRQRDERREVYREGYQYMFGREKQQ